ncbi:hypothetical protein EZS27_021123 [termite gut metagenome]|uniref:Uncharacterized protein n=1 Tax=termite gut metagenome TaxID=433724 RepID=A0A5J4R809_9ZZZZ
MKNCKRFWINTKFNVESNPNPRRHLRLNILENSRSQNCRYVFLGDYLDAKDDIVLSKKLDNFLQIIQLKKENPENVVLLLGNYDLLHFDYEINKSVSLIFRENASLFQNAYQD